MVVREVAVLGVELPQGKLGNARGQCPTVARTRKYCVCRTGRVCAVCVNVCTDVSNQTKQCYLAPVFEVTIA
jgi:hypothetical protein